MQPITFDYVLYTFEPLASLISSISQKNFTHQSGHTKDYFYGRNGQKWDGGWGIMFKILWGLWMESISRNEQREEWVWTWP